MHENNPEIDQRSEILMASKLLNCQEQTQLQALLPNVKIDKLITRDVGMDIDFAPEFHKLCDFVVGTLVIVRSDGWVAGGYSDQSWEGEEVYKQSSKGFLFSLNRRRVYGIKDTKMAIFCAPNSGPAFGGKFMRM